jgi:hypothetical protein
VNGWAVAFLGLIALSTVLMAAIQVGAIVFAARLGRRVERLTARVEQDIQPLIANLGSVSANAVRVSALAVAQVERADRLFADLTERLDQSLAVVQAAALAPVREGRAIMTGVRAAVAAFRELRREARARAGRADDEDALFIG